MSTPSAEEWRRVAAILSGLPGTPDADAAYIDQECGDDLRLKELVLAAIAARGDVDGFEDLSAPDLDEVSDRLGGSMEGPPRLAEGRQLGKYRIIDVLQSGGMGTTYLAERADKAFSRTVAIKVGRSVYGELDRDRQKREVTILGSLTHPHIVPLMDAGQTDEGFPYLVMDYVDGRPLTEYCDAQRLDVYGRLALFSDLLDALEYAHQNLVLHQDIKPSNILVTDDGVLRLLDFGISQMLSPEDGESVTGQTLGSAYTPDYAAPEQVRGELVTTAVDIYSLGVVLHELLTSERPTRLEAAGPVTLAPEIQGDLGEIVAKTLAEDPRDRYPTVDALRADLRRWVGGHPISIHAHRVGYRLRKLIARHRTAVFAAVLGLLALLGGITATLWQARRAAEEAARTEEVASFVMSLFESTDPNELGSSELRAEELLQQSIPRIETELAGQPLLQADLWMVVADGLQRLGNYDGALDLANRALERRQALLGDEDAMVAESLNRRSRLLYLKSEFEAAEPPLLEALEIRTDLFGTRHREVATSQDNLAELYRVTGRLEAADSLATLALGTRRELLPGDHIEVAWSLNNLAVIRRSLGRHDEARPLFEESLAMLLRLFPPTHSEVLVTKNNLANLVGLQGELPEAERLYREVLDTQMQVLGEAHPATTTTLNNLATVLYRSGDLAGAEDLFRRTLASWEARGEQNHTNAITTLNNLAAVLRSTGKADESVESARAAVAAWQELHGESDWRVGSGLLNLALALQTQGNLKQAEDALSEALPIIRTQPIASAARINAGAAVASFAAASGSCGSAPPEVAELVTGDADATDDTRVTQILAAAGCSG